MYYDDDFTSAELELIEMAESGLKAHGVVVPKIDADADIAKMAAEEEQVEEQAVEPTPVQPEQDREAEQPAPEFETMKTLSKKEQAIILYNDIAGKGHGRKMTLQRFMDVLGMSKAGASTYYQNIKSGKWK